MGGCYNKDAHPGSDICTQAEGGLCTECNTKNGLFKNPAAAPKPGNECILCWDTVGDGATKGVENCATCTAPGNAGVATCDTCQDGYYKDSLVCMQCDQSCLTCDGSGPNQCTSCKEGKYLKGTECVDKGTCKTDYYPDDTSMTCVACSTIQDCTACTMDQSTGKPKCTNCGSQKIPRTTLDGTSTCVENSYAGCQGTDKELFMKEDQPECLLCGDATTGTDPKDKGVANCRTCTKASATGAAPVCETCKEGYIKNGNGAGATCEACHQNCATCSEATTENKCLTCKEGFFLAGTGEGKCISCENGNDSGYSGLAGCLSCTAPAAPGPASCNRCKIGYTLQGTTCVKTCEDETACGGTSGACDAIVIGANGKELHYCSYCGEANKYPINGVCVSTGNENGNTCAKGVCTQCTTGYFMYMGGCYKVTEVPGKSMCTKAGDGVCTEAAAGYFIPPSPTKDKQSVLACSNPLGVELAGQKAYVGVDGCSQCTAPTAPSDAGMTPAVCTSCDSDRKPNKDGSGCVLCSVSDCKSCVVDDVCGECVDGYSLDNGKCVSMSTNRSGLSTGAIAGISVAVVVVVGGLVGFLCWWFLCRGKA
eukprot:XP_001707790.1 VSP [Giardia lamblia ATCC 50803]